MDARGDKYTILTATLDYKKNCNTRLSYAVIKTKN